MVLKLATVDVTKYISQFLFFAEAMDLTSNSSLNLGSQFNTTDNLSSLHPSDYYYDFMGDISADPTSECTKEHQEFYCGLISELEQAHVDHNEIDFSNITQSGWIWTSFGVFAPLCLFGVIGNILTIIMFSKYIKKTTTSIFIIALAILDLLVCCTTMPIWLYELFDLNHGSDFLCKFNKVIYLMSIPLSGGILLVIAIDRFLLIFLVKTNVVTRFRAKLIVFFLALICLAIAMPQALSFSTYTPIDRRLTSSHCKSTIYCNTGECLATFEIMSKSVWYHLWQSLIISFLVMVVAFTTIYSLIFAKVYTLHQRMLKWKQTTKSPVKTKISIDHATFSTGVSGEKSQGMSETNTGNGKNIVQKKRKRLPHLHTALTLFLVTIFFILAYAPLILMMFLGSCNDKTADDFSSSSTCGRNDYRLFIWHFYYLNHITNPIIYAFMNPRFRDAIRTCFTSLRKRTS